MFVPFPFGHTEIRVDARPPRDARAVSALEILRRVRSRRS
jgi:hypothetical protein